MIRLLSSVALALALALSASTIASAAPADDAGAVLKTLADAFNKGDAKAGAAVFAEDADLINPAGVTGKGRAAIEKVMAGDMAGIVKGATTKFSVETARELAPNVWLVDATHEAQNMMGPDGKPMTGKLHVVFVMTKAKDGKLQISAARPYMFLPAPPAASKPPAPTKPVPTKKG